MCLQGASRAGAGLLAALPDPALRLYYTWVPMLPGDTTAAAEQARRRLADPRAEHFWDGERRLSHEIGRALKISASESLGAGDGAGLAWDVYLAYGKGDTNLLRPRFWMHQLAVTHAPRLDAAAWRTAVTELLR